MITRASTLFQFQGMDASEASAADLNQYTDNSHLEYTPYSEILEDQPMSSLDK